MSNIYKMWFSTLCFLSLIYAQGVTAFQANYTEALQKSIYFFDAQRSGKLTDNRVPWRSDSSLNDAQVKAFDGTIVDLSGGYYDAGDNIKYGFPYAYSMTILAWSIYEFGDSYVQSGQLSFALNNLKWGTDYLLKAWHPEQQRLYAQVGTTDVDHDYYYVPYEVLDILHQQQAQPRKAYYVDPQYPGSDLAGSTAAALAAASVVFNLYGDPSYAQTLLTAAQQIYQFGKSYTGLYSDAVAQQGDLLIHDSYDSFSEAKQIYLGLAAAWLNKATGNSSYLSEAMNYIPTDVYGLDAESSNWSNNAAGAYLLLGDLAPTITVRQKYQMGLKNWIKIWQKVKKSPQGLISYSSEGNLSYVSNMGFLALAFSKRLSSSDPALALQIQQWIKGQADYILGNNSNGMSYLVGYGTKWPTHIQHATAQGGWSGIEDEVNTTLKKVPDRHIDFGALVGGPNKYDQYNDDREHYQSTETALDYVVGFQGMVAGLSNLYPGSALDNFPAAYDVSTPTLLSQYYIQTQLISQSSNKISVKATAYNHSYWPAQVIYKPSIRLFLNLNSLDPSRVHITTNTGQSLALQSYNQQNGIYYFVIELQNPIYPGGISTVKSFPIPSYRQVTFTIQTDSAHNFIQDWSLQNLTTTSTLNSHISFYGQLSLDGSLVKISGSEP